MHSLLSTVRDLLATPEVHLIRRRVPLFNPLHTHIHDVHTHALTYTYIHARTHTHVMATQAPKRKVAAETASSSTCCLVYVSPVAWHRPCCQQHIETLHHLRFGTLRWSLLTIVTFCHSQHLVLAPLWPLTGRTSQQQPQCRDLRHAHGAGRSRAQCGAQYSQVGQHSQVVEPNLPPFCHLCHCLVCRVSPISLGRFLIFGFPPHSTTVFLAPDPQPTLC